MKKIFVGNLDFGATEESIRTAFEAFGAVERVSLMTDRDTGRSRGFAFVEMTDASEADRAIAGLNGTNLGGRAINVNEARPKTEGGGGGGRREPRWYVDSPSIAARAPPGLADPSSCNWQQLNLSSNSADSSWGGSLEPRRAPSPGC